MMFSSRILLLLSSVAFAFAETKFPWPVCKKSDPKLDDCLKSAISTAIKDLKNGNKEYQVGALEPLTLNELVLHQGAHNAVGLNFNLKNVVLHGVSKTGIDNVKTDYKNMRIYFEGHVEGPLKIVSDYTAKGRVLVLPINGAGKANLVFDNFKAFATAHLKTVDKGGKKYLKCTNFDVNFNTTKLHMHFKRTVNADEALGKVINGFVNENWREILEEFRPVIAREISVFFKKYANTVFSKVPFDVIAPP